MKKTAIASSLLLLCVSNAYCKVTYLHSNPLGSIVAATDETGKQLWVKRYTPYGTESEASGTVSDLGANHSYATHEVDKETGLVYMKARYYDPALGRFYGVDPAGVKEEAPRSFNSFMYGENNPYHFIDPDGKEVVYAGFNVNIFGLGGAFGVMATYPGIHYDSWDFGVYLTLPVDRPAWLEPFLGEAPAQGISAMYSGRAVIEFGETHPPKSI